LLSVSNFVFIVTHIFFANAVEGEEGNRKKPQDGGSSKDGSFGVLQQKQWHPSEMTCADQRVDPSLEAAEAVNIH
jgi:hypothetical protein